MVSSSCASDQSKKLRAGRISGVDYLLVGQLSNDIRRSDVNNSARSSAPVLYVPGGGVPGLFPPVSTIPQSTLLARSTVPLPMVLYLLLRRRSSDERKRIPAILVATIPPTVMIIRTLNMKVYATRFGARIPSLLFNGTLE